MRLSLRPLREDDEAVFRAGHDAIAAEGHVFGLGLDDAPSWTAYLESLTNARHGVGLPDGFVPSTVLVADVDRVIVGRVSIRHQLNDFLAHEGGHIGYVVLAQHRRQGYATEMLRTSLQITSDLGITRVLVACDDDNLVSARVIERCGGVLENVVEGRTGVAKRRYWIDPP